MTYVSILSRIIYANKFLTPLNNHFFIFGMVIIVHKYSLHLLIISTSNNLYEPMELSWTKFLFLIPTVHRNILEDKKMDNFGKS